MYVGGGTASLFAAARRCVVCVVCHRRYSFVAFVRVVSKRTKVATVISTEKDPYEPLEL